ncbi:hypothetical protein OCOJLMKI_1144 [Methylobacterium iners]|uniref:DUF1508 domain-containing protein n=1 Tax=Methylobacterium iners TaxID=418707 RepID=A0ABQ4RT41_9HYPH|nr:hypothetical protein OCOJLMKI_1144 [Methylobacterium iners]
MATGNAAYRIQIRPAPSDPSKYLWTMCGTHSMFREEAATPYPSVEQALAEANARLGQLA